MSEADHATPTAAKRSGKDARASQPAAQAMTSPGASPNATGRGAASRSAASHANEIVAKLEAEILQGRLPPGTKLDERALAERFGVSRTPVREALHRLSASGLVGLGGRQGAQIVRLQVSDLLDAFFVVAELEGMAARLAARRIRPEEREVLRALHEECARHCADGDEEAFFLANTDFHSAIIKASRNRILQDQLRNARLLVAPYRYYATFRPGRMVSSIPEHEEIMTAIFQGDGAKAASLMSAHVNLLGDNLSDVLHILESHTQAAD
ncbi:GntR family transcriptional regulator [Labrys monachus]|uniref:DNA-binding GntR family transcriptional regulator n=1 Tax=Labrys monachus TaxID=217067 RepID=A0ABU0FJY5_9HYPH|nr:GntR family transcriptional regulator [Labrys monachus]MDQ0394365.1 DNA-binding GntR family transcriptional regulator [Labrys monachus]